MECEVNLAFKYANSDKHEQLVSAFKALDGTHGDYEELISSVARISNVENIDTLSESTYQTLFGNCDVKASDKKIAIRVTTGSDYETTVTEFINFVLSFGGKPLTCKVEMDESIVTFKHSKSGVHITHKDLWDE